MLKQGQTFIEQDSCCITHCNDVAISKDNLFPIITDNKYETALIDNFTNLSLLPHFGNILAIGDTLTITNPPNFTPTSLCVPPYTPKTHLYLYTQTKLRIFVVVTTIYPAGYSIVRNTTDMQIIEVSYDVAENAMRKNFVDALEDEFAIEVGATITNTGTSITISNATQEFGYIGFNINTLTPLENPAPNYFGFRTYWSISKQKLVAWNADKWITDCGSATSFENAFFRNFIDFSNKSNYCCKLSFQVENPNAFDIGIVWRTKDAGTPLHTAQVTTIESNTTKIIEYDFIVPNGAYLYNNGQFEVLDAYPIPNTNQFQTLDEWFYIDNLKYEFKNRIKQIEIKDCNSTNILVYNTCNDNYFINLSSYSGFVQLIITDANDNTYTSIPYKLIEDVICSKYNKIKWSNDCDGIEYELYLLGFIEKGQIDTIEEQSFVNYLGQKKSIYNHTIAKYEFRIHPYTESVIENMEYALKSNNITINDKEFYNGGDNLKVDSIDYCVFTARIDLYKKGTEHISKSCCC